MDVQMAEDHQLLRKAYDIKEKHKKRETKVTRNKFYMERRKIKKKLSLIIS